MMIKVGITGGIGSGKSTVARIYEAMGYPVYYSDDRAKWLMNNDTIIKEELINTFGKSVYPKQLDRVALANIVFSDKEALTKLNSITHPAVERDFIKWCEGQNSAIVFKEAAILFESNTNATVDRVICVTAPEDIKISRVIHRDGVSALQVKERMRNQWPDKTKIELSDYVIKTDDKQLVIPEAERVLGSILK